MAGISRKIRIRRTADRLGPRQLMVLDLGGGSTRVAILNRSQQSVRWEKACQWPVLNDNFTFGPEEKTLAAMLEAENISAEYASVITSSGGALIRLINFPGKPADREAMLAQVRQALGVDDSYLVQCQLLQELTKEKDGRDEFSVFAAALPATRVDRLRDWLGEAEVKPVSLRVSGIATANMVRETAGILKEGAGVGVLEIGHGSSMLLIFLGNELVLARQFKFGSGVLVDHLKTSFDLDTETAAKFYVSDSFDFSANIRPLIGPWLHQLAISLDFFERRHGKSVESVSVFGGGAQSRVVEGLISEHIRRPLVRWNPMDAIKGVQLLPEAGEKLKIFAPAVGEGLRMIRPGGGK